MLERDLFDELEHVRFSETVVAQEGAARTRYRGLFEIAANDVDFDVAPDGRLLEIGGRYDAQAHGFEREGGVKAVDALRRVICHIANYLKSYKNRRTMWRMG